MRKIFFVLLTLFSSIAPSCAYLYGYTGRASFKAFKKTKKYNSDRNIFEIITCENKIVFSFRDGPGDTEEVKLNFVSDKNFGELTEKTFMLSPNELEHPNDQNIDFIFSNKKGNIRFADFPQESRAYAKLRIKKVNSSNGLASGTLIGYFTPGLILRNKNGPVVYKKIDRKIKFKLNFKTVFFIDERGSDYVCEDY